MQSVRVLENITFTNRLRPFRDFNHHSNHATITLPLLIGDRTQKEIFLPFLFSFGRTQKEIFLPFLFSFGRTQKEIFLLFSAEQFRLPNFRCIPNFYQPRTPLFSFWRTHTHGHNAILHSVWVWLVNISLSSLRVVVICQLAHLLLWSELILIYIFILA